MTENVIVAVIVIGGVIFACNAWYLQGKIAGLREAKRIIEKHSNRKEQK